MEPKSPEDVYKTWLEPVPPRITILGEHLDSARQNLASSLVNGFVNAGNKFLNKCLNFFICHTNFNNCITQLLFVYFKEGSRTYDKLVDL